MRAGLTFKRSPSVRLTQALCEAATAKIDVSVEAVQSSGKAVGESKIALRNLSQRPYYGMSIARTLL